MEMNNQSKIVAGLIIALGILGFNSLIQQNQALAREEPTVPLDDGARHLSGLESKDSTHWDFAIEEGNQQQTNYQMRFYEADVRIVERKGQEWSNTGEQPNYSVLIDVFDFTEEKKE